MSYSELVCQLCTVTFNLARIRTSTESITAGWDYKGSHIFEQDPSASLCSLFPRESGCGNVRVDGSGGVLQHVAGQGCVFEAGYSGCRIGVQEMRGMNRARYLVRKPGEEWGEDGYQGDEDGIDGYQVDVNGGSLFDDGEVDGLEDGDGDGDENNEEEQKEYEKKSRWFLTASTTKQPLNDEKVLKRAKYAISGDEFPAVNYPQYQDGFDGDDDEGPWIGIPVHDACWKIFEKVSMRRLGKVDIDGFVALWSREACAQCGFQKLKQDPVIAECRKQWWLHRRGTEYLGANPVDIPGFKIMMRGTYKEESPKSDGVFPHRNFRKGHSQQDLRTDNPLDPFSRMPSEIKNAILTQLCSKDIASLRLASRHFRQLPKALFRKLIRDEMPWYWEVDDVKREEEDYLIQSFEESYGTDILDISDGINPHMLAFVQARMIGKHLDTNWLRVYKQLKVMEKGVSGFRNRVRVWKIVEEVVDRIERMTVRVRFAGAIAGVDFPICQNRRERSSEQGGSHQYCPRCAEDA